MDYLVKYGANLMRAKTRETAISQIRLLQYQALMVGLKPETGGLKYNSEKEQMELIEPCQLCHKRLSNNNFGPRHEASPNCESGKSNHCTCDVCF